MLQPIIPLTGKVGATMISILGNVVSPKVMSAVNWPAGELDFELFRVTLSYKVPVLVYLYSLKLFGIG